MMLAVDPGQTTGVVLVRGSLPSDLLLQASVPDYDPQPILAIAGLWYPLLKRVVLERPPAAGNDLQLLTLYGALLESLQVLELPVEQLSPGLWKPVLKQLNPPRPTGLKTKHERDAWGMAYVALRKEQKHVTTRSSG